MQQIFDYSEQPTGSRDKIMQQVEEVGVYIPENMSNNRKMSHVFPMSNLDWKKNTLEGGSFNTTTAIIIENQDSSDNDQHAKAITISSFWSYHFHTDHLHFSRYPGLLVIW